MGFIYTWVMVHGKLLSYQKPWWCWSIRMGRSINPLLVLYDLHAQYVQRGCILIFMVFWWSLIYACHSTASTARAASSQVSACHHHKILSKLHPIRRFNMWFVSWCIARPVHFHTKRSNITHQVPEQHKWGFPSMAVPQNRWLILENTNLKWMIEG